MDVVPNEAFLAISSFYSVTDCISLRIGSGTGKRILGSANRRTINALTYRTLYHGARGQIHPNETNCRKKAPGRSFNQFYVYILLQQKIS